MRSHVADQERLPTSSITSAHTHAGTWAMLTHVCSLAHTGGRQPAASKWQQLDQENTRRASYELYFSLRFLHALTRLRWPPRQSAWLAGQTCSQRPDIKQAAASGRTDWTDEARSTPRTPCGFGKSKGPCCMHACVSSGPDLLHRSKQQHHISMPCDCTRQAASCARDHLQPLQHPCMPQPRRYH